MNANQPSRPAKRRLLARSPISDSILTSLQCTLNGLLQCVLGLVQLHLNLHNAIAVRRVLELLNVPAKVALRLAVRVLLQARLIRPRRFGEFAGELVQDLAEQLVRDELVVVVIGDDDAGAALAARVDVDGELVLGPGLARARASGFGDLTVDLAADFADTVTRQSVSGVDEGCRWW